MVERKEKVEGTRRYTKDAFTLAADGVELYGVEVCKTFDESWEEPFLRIYVYPLDRDSYTPHIYFEDGYCDGCKPHFTVQTTSYGSLRADEFAKFMEANQQAMEVVAFLDKAVELL